MRYNLNNPPVGYIVHRKDMTEVHTGYNSGGPKVYMMKGHATAAANILNHRITHGYYYRYSTDTPKSNPNPWIVSPAHVALSPDKTLEAIKEYLKTNTPTHHTPEAIDLVARELLNIIKST